MVEVPDPTAGKIHVTGKMIKFSRTPDGRRLGPHGGPEHLRGASRRSHYSDDRIRELQDANVVRTGDAGCGGRTIRRRRQGFARG